MPVAQAIIVPARLRSERFPRKLLHPVRGVPLILWTARRIRQECPDVPLFFAVAEDDLADALADDGFEAVLTAPDLASGSDRIAAANREIGAAVVVNVQADEPLVSRGQIKSLFDLVASGAEMSTLAAPLDDPERFADPNQVKVVRALDGRALYFSRAPIPWFRDSRGSPGRGGGTDSAVLGHLGLYGYDARFLEKFVSWPPSPLERIERLEQLRALENGAEIAVGVTEEPAVGVDTQEDVARLEEALGGTDG